MLTAFIRHWAHISLKSWEVSSGARSEIITSGVEWRQITLSRIACAMSLVVCCFRGTSSTYLVRESFMQRIYLHCVILHCGKGPKMSRSVSYTHLRAHETPEHLVCRLLLE